MKRIALIMAAWVLFVLALPANSSADFVKLDGDIASPGISNATCTKRTCRVKAACPALNPVTQSECTFELALGAKKSRGEFTRPIFELGAKKPSTVEDRLQLQEGETKRVALPVTKRGRREISKALRAGKQALGGKWSLAVFYFRFEEAPPGSGNFWPQSYFGHRNGSVRIKLKG